MAKKCNQLEGEIKISKGFSGTYKTKNKLTDQTYSYYCSGKDVHFTIDETGGGKNDFKKFHITYGSFNAHVWYVNGKPKDSDPKDRKFNKSLPDKEYGDWCTWLDENLGSLNGMAKEFWEGLNS